MAKSESRTFTLEEIKRAFEPRCCHVTGMHDPQHWQNDPAKLCSLQAFHAYKRGLAALGISYGYACSDLECYWCNEYKDTKKFFKPSEFAKATAPAKRKKLG